MRKRLKRKRRSCPLCKPNKVGLANRWAPRDFDRLVRDEKEIMESVGKPRRED